MLTYVDLAGADPTECSVLKKVVSRSVTSTNAEKDCDGCKRQFEQALPASPLSPEAASSASNTNSPNSLVSSTRSAYSPRSPHSDDGILAYSVSEGSNSCTSSDTAHTQDDLYSTYDLIEEIGRGCFATVHKARHKVTRALVAVKLIARNQTCSHEEVDVMLRLDHPHCVELHKVFKTDDQIQLVMDYVDGGDLFDAVTTRNFQEGHVRRLMQQICEGVQHLHTKRIIHCDLKPENILLFYDAGSAKVADFGLSRLFPEDAASVTVQTRCGTPGYCAPEVINRQICGAKIDIWACGVICYILLCGYPPFPMDMDPDSLEKVTNAEFQFPAKHWSVVSETATDLIGKMLVADPNERLSIDGVLAHPWFAESAPCTAPPRPSAIFTTTQMVDDSLATPSAKNPTPLYCPQLFSRPPMHTPGNLSPLYSSQLFSPPPMRTPESLSSPCPSRLCSSPLYSPEPLSTFTTPVKGTLNQTFKVRRTTRFPKRQFHMSEGVASEAARKQKLKKEAVRARLLKNFKTTAALELAAALDKASAMTQDLNELPLLRRTMSVLDIEMELDLAEEQSCRQEVDKVNVLVGRHQPVATTSTGKFLSFLRRCSGDTDLSVTLCFYMDSNYFPFYAVLAEDVGTPTTTGSFTFSCTIPYEAKAFTMVSAA